MSYKPRMEPNITADNPLVKLTDRIEAVIAQERVELAMSALLSAMLRAETAKCGGNTREAAEHLAHAFRQIARNSNN
jgi:hypothetical protein